MVAASTGAVRLDQIPVTRLTQTRRQIRNWLGGCAATRPARTRLSLSQLGCAGLPAQLRIDMPGWQAVAKAAFSFDYDKWTTLLPRLAEKYATNNPYRTFCFPVF